MIAKPKAVSATPQTTQVPPWLNTMRAISGTKEASGSADNPQILAMADYIGQKFPETAAYSATYTHDSIAWCGLATAYCCATADIHPPFGPTDTDCYLWAQSFAHDGNFVEIEQPRLGCIVVMTRDGGGHVTLYESTSGSNYNCRGGNQSDMVNVSSYAQSTVIALMWPKDVELPPAERRELEEGDEGSDVAEVQRILGLPDDGDFGPMTDNAVCSFQAAANLDADGVVGQNTWAALDELNLRMTNGSDGLNDKEHADIVDAARASPLMNYSWRDRGKAPPGYIPGMALCYALAVKWLYGDIAYTEPMAAADTGQTDTDALAWLRADFAAKGMNNSDSGVDTMRHLFVLMIGLGMRESSGKYCEGRDMSADNVEADTAEAGLFQTSWNINTSHAQIPKLMDKYGADPNGFRPVFDDGIEPTASNWDGYGTGNGARYQWLAKYCPAFATMVTAIGLRKRRQHWGPVNRREVEILEQADELLAQVQELVTGAEPEPEPPQPPLIEEPEVAISIAARGRVKVTVNGDELI